MAAPKLTMIPSHLLAMEIMARLSSTDLINLKLSCKAFTPLTDDPYVLKHVTIDPKTLPPVSWHVSECASSFLRRCSECHNPEALYRKGMVDFFSLVDMESGLRGLRGAAERGHVEASYVLGMILLSAGEEAAGLGLVSGIESLRSFVSFKDCRDEVKGFLANVWVSDRVVRLLGRGCSEGKRCSGCGSIVRKVCARGWSDDDDGVVDDEGCESCKFYRQLVLFSTMLCSTRW